MTPSLKSSRLVLAPYRASLVVPRHVEWLNDPEIVEYSEQRHKSHTESSQHSYLNGFTANDHIWLITVKPENVLKDIGTITAHIDPHNNIADMGILIGEKTAWDKGYGTEAWKSVMDWLFQQKVRKIECGTMMDNRAMRRIATNCKMTVEAVRIQHFLLQGKPTDLLLYGRLRP